MKGTGLVPIGALGLLLGMGPLIASADTIEPVPLTEADRVDVHRRYPSPRQVL